MDKKKIKRIIAREGLIILAVSVILFFAGLLFLQIDFQPQKYKLELADGTVRYISIMPDIKDMGSKSNKKIMITMYHPTTPLILKRLNEFKETNKVEIILATPYTPWKDHVLEIIAYFVMSSIFLQIVFTYLFILLIRFIIWAIRTLRGTNGSMLNLVETI